MSKQFLNFPQSSQKRSQEEQIIQNDPNRTPIKKLYQYSTQYNQDEKTVDKNYPARNPLFSQASTPRPQRKIILYDEYKQRHLFPLYKDKDLGIPKEYQDMLIESWNDDDKKTSSTQLRRGMDQTLQDLYDVFGADDQSQRS